MSCTASKSLCACIVISQSVTFADGNVVVNIPAAAYNNHQKVCLVIAQAIPTEATIAAPVVITIGEGTEQYPLTTRCCAPVTVCGIRTRTRYTTYVETSATGAVFKMVGGTCPCPSFQRASIDGTAPAAAPATPAAT